MEKLNTQPQTKLDKIGEEALPLTPTPKRSLPLIPLLLGLTIVVGIASGIFFAKSQLVSTTGDTRATDTAMPSDQSGIKVGTTYGSKDESNFKDVAQGVLVAGGVNGEGSHHLVRPGGASQNVYLSSSVVDLDTVINARVQVWGQTMGAKKAGWLIDVGRLKVLELNAPMPE